MNYNVKIDSRLNIIYYQDINESIQEYRIYQFEKIKVGQAKEILKDLGIQYTKILKVLLEPIKIEIPKEELKKYIIKGDK